MPPLLRVLIGKLFIFPKDFQVPVFDNEDIVKKKRGQHIDGSRENDGLSTGCKTGMFDKV